MSYYFQGAQVDQLHIGGIPLSHFFGLLSVLYPQQERGVEERVHVWRGPDSQKQGQLYNLISETISRALRPFYGSQLYAQVLLASRV